MKESLRSGMGVRKLLSKGWKYLEPPSPGKVFWVNFAVTNLCNSRCTTCRIWEKYRMDAELLKSELTLDEIDKAFSESQCLRELQGVGITGGEPFLRRDLVDLAGLFIKRYPEAFISVATNGLAGENIVGKTQDIMQRFNPKFFGVSVSLDGIGEVHDKMRGVTGHYQRTIDTITRLRQQTGVQVGIHFTITPANSGSLMEVFELSRRLGLKFISCFAHNSTVYYGNQGTDFTWEPGHMRKVEAIVKAIARAKANDESLLLKLVDPYTYFLGNAAEQAMESRRRFRCFSGTHSFFLNPYGDVLPCLFLPEKFGNIREAPFDRFWLSPEALRIRQEIRNGKCSCWVACETVPSLFRRPELLAWNLRNKILRRGP